MKTELSDTVNCDLFNPCENPAGYVVVIRCVSRCLPALTGQACEEHVAFIREHITSYICTTCGSLAEIQRIRSL